MPGTSRGIVMHTAAILGSIQYPPSTTVLTSAAIITAAGVLGRFIRSTQSPVSPVRRALYFWRHAGPIVAHYRFTQWWLERTTTSEDREYRDAVYGRLDRRYCQPTLDIILHLRGLYVKIGQVMSSRPDFVPLEYVRLFATLQDSIPQWPIEEVKEIIGDALREELGLSRESVFQSIDSEALGSASIGQVHRAVLSDGWEQTQEQSVVEGHFLSDYNDKYTAGNVVAVKVMHPGAESLFRHDFQVFRWLCRVALPGWRGLVDELERRLMSEFDYHNEALSLRDVRKNLSNSPYKKYVAIPQPHLRLCCKNILVMEMLNGKKLVDDVEDRLASALGGKKEAAKEMIETRKHEILESGQIGATERIKDSLLATAGLLTKIRLFLFRQKCKHYVDLLLDVHGRQIFVDGAFNGDPHPGNVLVLDDNRMGLIDFGQTRRLDDNERLAYAKVVHALGNDMDDASIAKAAEEAGFSTKKKDDFTTLSKYATLFFDSDDESAKLGFATPQLYFASLMHINPLTSIPDGASKYSNASTLQPQFCDCVTINSLLLLNTVFIARTSFLFRGMGGILGSKSIHTAHRWSKHAQEALAAIET